MPVVVEYSLFNADISAFNAASIVANLDSVSPLVFLKQVTVEFITF